MLIFKDHISEGLDVDELLEAFLDGAHQLGSNIDESDNVWLPNAQGKDLDGFLHRISRVRIFNLSFKVIHDDGAGTFDRFTVRHWHQ